MKTTSDKVVGLDMLARLFELDTIKVIGDINSGATDFMASGKALLCFTPNKPSKYQPSAGYTIAYNKYKKRVLTDRIPMRHLNNALRIEAKLKIDPIVLSTDLGLYAYDVV